MRTSVNYIGPYVGIVMKYRCVNIKDTSYLIHSLIQFKICFLIEKNGEVDIVATRYCILCLKIII